MHGKEERNLIPSRKHQLSRHIAYALQSISTPILAIFIFIISTHMLIERLLQLRDTIDTVLDKLERNITKAQGETKLELAEMESELRAQHDEVSLQIAELEQQGESLTQEVREKADSVIAAIQQSIEEIMHALRRTYQTKGGG